MNDMLSLVLHRRKFARKITSDVKLKVSDGAEKSLRELFNDKPGELLSAFRMSQWTIPAVSVSLILNQSPLFETNGTARRMATSSPQTT